MVKQTYEWMQTMTTIWFVMGLVGLILSSFVMRYLAHRGIMSKHRPLQVIGITSEMIGGFAGSVLIILLFIIVWPKASNWIVNSYLADTGIWQAQFQKWLTKQVSDDTAASAIGLLLGKIPLGVVAMGYVIGRLTSWSLKKTMTYCYHSSFATRLAGSKQIDLSNYPLPTKGVPVPQKSRSVVPTIPTSVGGVGMDKDHK